MHFDLYWFFIQFVCVWCITTYTKVVEMMMSTLSTGKLISMAEPWTIEILFDNRLSCTTRRVNCTIFDLSMAYTCFAPAIAANIDNRPKPHLTSSTICRWKLIKTESSGFGTESKSPCPWINVDYSRWPNAKTSHIRDPLIVAREDDSTNPNQRRNHVT